MFVRNTYKFLFVILPLFSVIVGFIAFSGHAAVAQSPAHSHPYFLYGMIQNDEAFYTTDGEIGGFAAQMCLWLTDKFGVPFIPVIFDDLPQLMAALEDGSVHFTGQLPRTDSLLETFHMTDPISMRSVAIVRTPHQRPLDSIAQSRPLRLGFMHGSVLHSVLDSMSVFQQFEYFHMNIDEATELLRVGDIDAFIGDGVLTHSLLFPGKQVDAFYPFIFGFASFATRDPELFHIVDAVQFYLQENGIGVLCEIFGQGIVDANRHRISLLLTCDEIAFIESNPIIPIAIHASSYPISFYSATYGRFEGIAHDVLRQIETVTGLTFEIVTYEHQEMPQMAQMLRRGDAWLAAGVFSERIAVGGVANPFLMSDPFFVDQYAFLSRREQATVNIGNLLYMHVGLLDNNVYNTLFHHLFPHHNNYTLFDHVDDLIDALEKGEIDLTFYSLRGLIRTTNYFERTGIRSNFVLDESYTISFAIKAEQEHLLSIINKALQVIDTDALTNDWMARTFDFRLRVLQAQMPFLYGIIISALIIIALLSTIFFKSIYDKRRLAQMVADRTDILEKESATLNSIIDAMDDVLFCKDLELKYTRVNKSFEELLGTGRMNTIGNDDYTGVNIPADTATEWRNVDNRVIAQRRTIRQEELVPSMLDGSMRVYDTIKTPLIQGDKVYGLLGIARDITERKEYEDNLEAASKAKSAFLAHMSHEMRTPMNSIMGFSELAMEHEMSENVRTYLARINSNAQNLLDIINDILDVSKIESAKVELEHIPFSLADVVKQCSNATTLKAIEKGLELEFDIPNDCDSKQLVGDPLRLRQVLINLISNGIKFTEQGKVCISCTVVAARENDITLNWQVTDTGIGMTAEQIEIIAEPFVQADSSITRKYGGTGLGIPIVKSILNLMGGELAITSTLGAGSTFGFTLTFDIFDITKAGGLGHMALVNRPQFNGEVLVCEDSEMNQLVLAEHLERVGLKVVIANNGKEGLDIVAKRAKDGQKPFDLILMDIFMPVMDGLVATAEIKKLGVETPIVAVTANVMQSDRELYLDNGMVGCLGKPFTAQDLWECLLGIL